MSGAPSGFLGKLSAERPVILSGVLGLGLVVLAVLGARQMGPAADTNIFLSRFSISALIAVFVPVALAAFTPRRRLFQIPYVIVLAISGMLLCAYVFGFFGDQTDLIPPLPVSAALGLFLFLSALNPITRNVIRLGVVVPLSIIIGGVGAIGFFALLNLLTAQFAAPALAIGLAGGMCVGMSVASEFAQLYAKGLSARNAAASAGHAALAPAWFCFLAAASYGLVVSLQLNVGVIDWQIIFAVAGTSILISVMSLVSTTGLLAVLRHSEQVAVDENQRRQRFVESWRPMRRLLPSSTALAASAIIGVLVVITAFETGIANPISLLLFIGMMIVASGAAFVSVRTSLLIALMLFISTTFVGFVYSAFGFELPTLAERTAGLTLAAIGFTQITVSWRNAGDIWRNARDVAQNAMCDGLRRFVVVLGASAAALIVATEVFGWEAGLNTASYFAVVAGIGLFISPVLMVAMSAQLQKY